MTTIVFKYLDPSIGGDIPCARYTCVIYGAHVSFCKNTSVDILMAKITLLMSYVSIIAEICQKVKAKQIVLKKNVVHHVTITK